MASYLAPHTRICAHLISVFPLSLHIYFSRLCLSLALCIFVSLSPLSTPLRSNTQHSTTPTSTMDSYLAGCFASRGAIDMDARGDDLRVVLAMNFCDDDGPALIIREVGGIGCKTADGGVVFLRAEAVQFLKIIRPHLADSDKTVDVDFALDQADADETTWASPRSSTSSLSASFP